MNTSIRTSNLHAVVQHLLMILALMAVFTVWGVAPQLNNPRVDDHMTIERLGEAPMWLDSTMMCPDLSDARPIGTVDYRVWAPVPGDTVTVMLEVIGRQVNTIVSTPDGLAYSESTKPGYYRVYDSTFPAAVPWEYGKHRGLTSHERVDNIGSVATDGEYTISNIGGLRLVTAGSDTLSNVECVETRISQTIAFGDTLLNHHDGHIRKWYAPGYRYPVLTLRKDVLTDDTGVEIDREIQWEMTDTETQAEMIKNDELNEEIRRLLSLPSEDVETMRNRYASGQQDEISPYITIDRENGVLTVARPFGNDAIHDLLLCDIHGRVHHAAPFDSASATMTVSISRLSPGVYLLYIGTDSEPVVYRFMI